MALNLAILMWCGSFKLDERLYPSDRPGDDSALPSRKVAPAWREKEVP